jgi:hypothetical protein
MQVWGLILGMGLNQAYVCRMTAAVTIAEAMQIKLVEDYFAVVASEV